MCRILESSIRPYEGYILIIGRKHRISKIAFLILYRDFLFCRDIN